MVEPVVLVQVGQVVPVVDVAVGDALGQGHHLLRVKSPSQVDGVRHGLHRGSEPGRLAGARDCLETRFKGSVVGPVEVFPYVVGHVGADGAVMPRAWLGGEQREHLGRVLYRARRTRVDASELGDRAAGLVLDGDRRGADGHVHTPAVHAGADLVPVGVDFDDAVLVGLPRLPAHRVEPARRQGTQRLEVVGEQVVDRIQGPVVDRLAQFVAFGEHETGELLMGLRAQRRDHEIAAKESDRVLHAALLMPRIRVAEPHVEPAVADERLEHGRERHLASGVSVSGAGCVVDHERVRDAADMLEHGHEPHGGCIPRSPPAG